ncbi:PadR family transcriptional regulator [Bacillus cereus group sp. BfR-BA-01380]|uniref:PadR family transcriptional regulator n=1 Tax=Bacillus cereus group sp. BfR-BA-01380 TaxID=2920324 RepID=UPI001F55D9DE|nr:hypothetical protein [Bacillus cereus group sp. BfR-BA-01380]
MSIRYALLGLLSKKEQTGYDLHHTFQEQLIYFWNSGHSQVYKELSKVIVKRQEFWKMLHDKTVQEINPVE